MGVGLRWEATHIHVKTGGMYRVLHHGMIEKTGELCVIYQGADGGIWVRPDSEFYDGRFEAISDSR